MPLVQQYPVQQYPVQQYWVVSSVVERLVYTEDVGGSKPSPPTSLLRVELWERNLIS